MQKLDEEKKEKGRLPEEEYKVFQNKLDDLMFRKTESFNYRQTLDPHTQKDEIKKIDAEQKKFAEEIKKTEAELKNAQKAKKDALKSDTAYLQSWYERKEKLKKEYSQALLNTEITESTKKRNRTLAREIVLSVGRFPFFRKVSNIQAIFKKLEQGMKEGINLSDPAEREKLYSDITFRVEFKEENENGYNGFANIDLAKMKYAGDWMEVRGERIATVFQDPMTSLNPIITIGKQITSVIIKHQHCSEAEARKRALVLMKKVGIPNAEKRFDDYPFQYSGGMRQRIVIAIALSCQPKILICDEPTTALDVTIQAQILKLIKDLQKEFGYTIVFITHDLGVVANIADRVAVLYAGQIVELGKVEEVFYDPKHPYTWALLSSLPQLAQRNTKLFSIQGTPPSLYNKIIGDPFAPRNQYCMKIDTLKEPPYFPVSDTHIAKTWLLDPRSPKVDKPEIICNIHEKLMRTYHITEGEQ
ncbi:MAG: ATP-binding cassette domain-containing protein [Lachnospiraceae bacterium]|nr:ATP-binding cassette domain-containing protein [Lachnospiraceae bacterium]